MFRNGLSRSNLWKFFFVEVVTLVHVSKKSILIVIRGCYLLGKQTALQIFPKLVGWTMMVKARVLSNSLTLASIVCVGQYMYMIKGEVNYWENLHQAIH